MGSHIRMGILSNGIRIIVQERESEAVAFVFMVGCGSRNEKDSVVGVSHALEHSMFKGTPTRTAYDIAKETEGRGASTNAFTSEERTGYWFYTPIDIFEEIAEVYADCLNNSLLDKNDWAKEKQVIQEERQSCEEDNSGCASGVLLPKAMFNLQMGVIGSRETIQRIKPFHMRKLIKEWYLPQNIVISVAGGIEPDRVIGAAEKFFGNSHKSWDINANLSKLKPLPSKSNKIYTERIVKQAEQTNISIGFRSYSFKDNRRYAAKILSEILGGGMSSRLFQEVREKRALAYAVYSNVQNFTDSGVFSVDFATTKPTEAFEVVLDEARKIANLTATTEELRDAKTAIKAVSKKKESSISFAFDNAVSALLYNRIIPREETYEKIDSVTKEDVLAAAKEILTHENMTVAVCGPKSLEKNVKKFIKK